METMEILMKGALLHDLGKILQRAGAKGSHPEAGRQFLAEFLGDSADEKQLLRCVSYHHERDLKEANLAADDLSYIVCEADNISAGMDRRAQDVAEDGPKFNKEQPLASIFNLFGGSGLAKQNKSYRLLGLDPEQKFNYPVAGSYKVSSGDYADLERILRSNFQKVKPALMAENELLRILEDVASYVPSSTSTEEVPDVSLYTHSKIAAAVAAAMKQYFDAHAVNDYRQACLIDKDKFRAAKAFSLISGDISGIQDFIYTITSAGALRALRGRSLYLEIFLENFIDELLTQLKLSRANLLYSGGGHFYLLAAQTQETQSALTDLTRKCNEWLLKNYGVGLYLAAGSTSCSAEELLNSGSQRNIFQRVGEAIAAAKLKRYDNAVLKELLRPQSKYTQDYDAERECAVCRRSTLELVKDGEVLVCRNCRALRALGEKALTEDSVFLITDRASAQGVKLFSAAGDLWLVPIKRDEVERGYTDPIVCIYSKNTALTGKPLSLRLYLADYCARGGAGEVLDFSELAAKSRGIKRLGVLRADVDNLGAAFISGFIDKKQKDKYHYATFSRYADLSRDMSLFFKLAVNKIIAGGAGALPEAIKPFQLPGTGPHTGGRAVSVVYSGGDDLFLVGAWDQLLETAVDIYHAFQYFSCGKLSFSAGLALFNDSFPVAMMAELTARLEDAAKARPSKNSVALFGMSTETTASDAELSCEHVYAWQDFIAKVCGEKLEFLQRHLALDDKESRNKLPGGKTLLYRLKQLCEEVGRERAQGQAGINLARFAYTLARLEPKDAKNDNLQRLFQSFTPQLYAWVQNDEDRKQLLTALDLWIYLIRE